MIPKRTARGLASKPLIAVLSVLPLASIQAQSRQLLVPKDDATDNNRVSISSRMLWNVSVKIRGGSPTPPPAAPGSTTTTRTYDDGFVGVDASGNAGGVTSLWRYDNASQYDPAGAGGDGTITYTHSSVESSVGELRDNPSQGFEVAYQRDLGKVWKGVLGIEVGTGYTYLKMDGDRRISSRGFFDTYGLGGEEPLEPGVTGPFNRGDSVLLDASPISRTEGVGPTINVTEVVRADIFGQRIGSFYRLQYQKVSFQAAGGLAMAVVRDEFNQEFRTAGSSTVRSRQGGTMDYKFLLGPYVSATLGYEIAPRWTANVGVQFQNLGNYHHRTRGGTARFDFGESLYGLAGVQYSF